MTTTCQWFALCDHPATDTEPHPVLGDVPICDRCRRNLERWRAYATTAAQHRENDAAYRAAVAYERQEMMRP